MRLQNIYADLSGLPDASRLAYLHGPRKRWDESQIAEMWSSADSHSASGVEVHNHMYVHVPFCKSICSFCNYERLRPSRPGLLREYVDRVVKSIERISPQVKHLQFSSLYFGGGTPSVLPASLLKELLVAIDSSFSFYADNCRAFEFDPAVMNAEKLRITREHNFSRYSFGIQTLEASVMKNHNRGFQRKELVEKRFTEMRQQGVRSVSCDILLGLAGTNAPQLIQEIDELLANYQPQQVDIFMLTPTHEYVSSHFNGSFEAFWAHIAPFEELVPKSLPKIAERNGYDYVGGQSHVLRLTKRMSWVGDQRNARSYTQLSCQSKNPINLLGLGPSARSSIFGKAMIQCQAPEKQGEYFFYEGHQIDISAEGRLYLAHTLRDNNSIDLSEYKQVIGKDLVDVHPVAVAAWQSDGLVNIERGVLRWKEQKRRERTRSLLWLVPEDKIEYEVARRWRLQLDHSALEERLLPFVVGSEITAGVRLQQIEDQKIILQLPSGMTLPIRVAPGWDKHQDLRLVLLKGPPEIYRKSVLRTLKILKKLLYRTNHR